MFNQLPDKEQTFSRVQEDLLNFVMNPTDYNVMVELDGKEEMVAVSAFDKEKFAVKNTVIERVVKVLIKESQEREEKRHEKKKQKKRK